MPVLTFDQVKKNYGSTQVIQEFTAEVPDKEFLVLLGPSGCGKSTFLKTLNRMNDLVEGVKITGRVLLDGEDIYGGLDVTSLRKRVGMVFQQPNPFPFSIYENIVYGLRIAGIKDKEVLDERVETSLKQAAIWDEVKDDLKKSAVALSGGQQQRICIARVLAVRPEVILLDEPTSALDPVSSSLIEEMLLKLKEEYTCIIVTHNMQQASRISDTTSFFLNGELIETGLTKKIFVTPDNKKTDDYLSGRFG